MYILSEILISLIISIIPILFYLKDRKKDKKNLPQIIIASLILLVGCLARTLFIEKYPVGLNQDEASIGYEAFSLLKYGIDRNGLTLPIHFISWGSGQNALYGYLIMPIIFLFGNTIFSIRLTMAIIGCITLLVAYFLFKDIFKEKESLIPLFVFAITPWHIMKSRWGLESNIFPDLVFYAITLLYYGIKTKKQIFYILTSIILGISTYAYGTSYLYVPIISIITYIYLIKKKHITIKQSIKYISITGLIALPLVILLYINYYEYPTITFLNITIPNLYATRYTEETATNGNFIINCIYNFKRLIVLLITQKDEIILNYSPTFGLLYKFSFPIMLLGIYKAIISKKEILLKINNILLISSVFIGIYTYPNINRMNIIWIPLIIYLGYGMLCIYKYNKKIITLIICLYIISFSLFTFDYYKNYQKQIKDTTFNGIENAIKYTNKLEYNKLYITERVGQPYIYYLYFNEIDPNYYLKYQDIPDKIEAFQSVKSIKNIYFNLPDKLEKNNVYILTKKELEEYDTSKFKIKKYKYYYVVY